MSRHVLERNAEQRLPLRSEETDDRPSYSADYLAELRQSTPSTPRDLVIRSDAPDTSTPTVLDIASKFGSSALVNSTYDPPPSAIPTDTEIREKKERRRRLAKEQEYISLNDVDNNNVDASQSDDSDRDEPRHRSLIIPADELKPRDKYVETRLVHEDEDMAEGFDSFVEDAGKVTLKGKAAKEQERQRKKDIAEQIRSAQHGYGYGADASSDETGEGEGGDSVDEEEVARNAAYEAAQTRAGTYSAGGNNGARRWEKEKAESLRRRLEMQPKIRPIPDLKTLVARFWETVKAKEEQVAMSRKRLEAVQREKEEIEGEEVRIQELLREAGERYERLRAETGGNTAGSGDAAAKMEQRGLDNLGSMAETPYVGTTPTTDDDVAEDEAPAATADGMLAALGMKPSFSGMMGRAVRDEEEDW